MENAGKLKPFSSLFWKLFIDKSMDDVLGLKIQWCQAANEIFMSDFSYQVSDFHSNKLPRYFQLILTSLFLSDASHAFLWRTHFLDIISWNQEPFAKRWHVVRAFFSRWSRLKVRQNYGQVYSLKRCRIYWYPSVLLQYYDESQVLRQYNWVCSKWDLWNDFPGKSSWTNWIGEKNTCDAKKKDERRRKNEENNFWYHTKSAVNLYIYTHDPFYLKRKLQFNLNLLLCVF